MSSVRVKMLFDDLLMMDDGAVVADTFEGDEVTLGDVGGIELDAGLTLGICRDFRIPVECGTMIWARLLVLVRIMWRIELNVGFPTLLLNGCHTEWLAPAPGIARLQVYCQHTLRRTVPTIGQQAGVVMLEILNRLEIGWLEEHEFFGIALHVVNIDEGTCARQRP